MNIFSKRGGFKGQRAQKAKGDETPKNGLRQAKRLDFQEVQRRHEEPKELKGRKGDRRKERRGNRHGIL